MKKILLSEKFDNDIAKHKKSGSKLLLKKIYNLIIEISENPFHGTGKPEQLRYFDIPTWSR